METLEYTKEELESSINKSLSREIETSILKRDLDLITIDNYYERLSIEDRDAICNGRSVDSMIKHCYTYSPTEVLKSSIYYFCEDLNSKDMQDAFVGSLAQNMLSTSMVDKEYDFFARNNYVDSSLNLFIVKRIVRGRVCFFLATVMAKKDVLYCIKWFEDKLMNKIIIDAGLGEIVINELYGIDEFVLYYEPNNRKGELMKLIRNLKLNK
tara:strand:+ start:969 stop:1601 length:633 start_codon:yes stop_codon:yes gene_type:complete